MSPASEKVLALESEARGGSELPVDLLTRPRCNRAPLFPHVRPTPCLRIQRWGAFSTPPWGPQMENEHEPSHLLPSVWFPGAVASAGATQPEGGSSHSLGQAARARTPSLSAGPESQGVLTVVCLVSTPRPGREPPHPPTRSLRTLRGSFF